MPNAVVNIERNGGFGATVIAKLLTTSIKRNLFFTIKDKVIEERIGGGQSMVRKQKTKVFGSDSTHEEREKLMDILRNRVDFHKDKIISKTIYDELCGLEVKKNGRIEHSSNTHDDQIFSWLWALYIIYEGGELMRTWGIERHEIKTDAELDEAVYDFDKPGTTIDLDFGVTSLETQEMIDQQMQQLNQAPGKMLYQEWVKKEVENDKKALEKLLRDPEARKAYAQQMHLNPSELEPTGLTTIPDEVFLSMDPTDMNQGPDQGNLSGFLGRLARVIGR